ncbi:MAG TPA: site-specific integrase [Ignavibacteriales bacterium]|nr:site-specific integrase [Ignavibacteriales bacterium]
MAKRRLAFIRERDGYLYLCYREKGKRHKEGLRLKATRENKNLANGIAIQKEAELMRGMYEIGRFVPLSIIEAMETFKDHKKKQKLKTNSMDVYESAFKEFSRIIGGEKKVYEVTHEDVEKFKEGMKIKPFPAKEGETDEEKRLREARPPVERSENTIATYNNHMKILFDFLVEKKYVSENPFSHMEGKKNMIVTIPDEDFDKIYKFFSNVKRTDEKDERETEKLAREEQLRFIKLLQLTGLRTGEAVSLKWENINYAQGIIKVRNEKEDRDDYIDLIPQIRELLDPIRKRSGKIFSYTEDGLKFFPRAMKRLGMSYCLHDIRRTFGSKLANNGMRPLDLMAAMRHKNIKTTMKYYINMEIKRIGGIISETFTDRPLDSLNAAEEITPKSIKNKQKTDKNE